MAGHPSLRCGLRATWLSPDSAGEVPSELRSTQVIDWQFGFVRPIGRATLKVWGTAPGQRLTIGLAGAIESLPDGGAAIC